VVGTPTEFGWNEYIFSAIIIIHIICHRQKVSTKSLSSQSKP
jgi:hypothetical protein